MNTSSESTASSSSQSESESEPETKSKTISKMAPPPSKPVSTQARVTGKVENQPKVVQSKANVATAKKETKKEISLLDLDCNFNFYTQFQSF